MRKETIAKAITIHGGKNDKEFYKSVEEAMDIIDERLIKTAKKELDEKHYAQIAMVLYSIALFMNITASVLEYRHK